MKGIKMNYEEEVKCVEKLKTTWTAFGGLTKEEQEFLKGRHACALMVVCIDGTTSIKEHNKFFNGTIYRLSPDFQLPAPERWWYCNDRHELQKTLGSMKCCVEVPASDLEYVRDCMKRPDIAEFEYRRPNVGEEYIAIDGGINEATVTREFEKRFVRKAKPVPKMAQKEFEVWEDSNGIQRVKGLGQNYCPDKTLSKAWLYAIDRGMAPDFVFKNSTGLTIKDIPYLNRYDNGTPATCVKMRVLVGEEKG